MSAVESWSKVAANNNATPPDGAPEGMQPAALNNCLREVMASVRTLTEQYPWLKLYTGYTVVRNSATQFQISSVDLTAIYTVGRRVRQVGASTVYGTIASSSFTGGHTLVDMRNDAGAAIPTSLVEVSVAATDATSSPAPFTEEYYIPATAWLPGLSGGCAPLIQWSTGGLDQATLDFDGTTSEYAFITLMPPEKWDGGTITAKFHYLVSAAVSTTVRWELRGLARPNGMTTVGSYGTAQGVTHTYFGAADAQGVTPYTPAITLGGTPAQGAIVTLAVLRNPTIDTTSQDARLAGVMVRFGLVP